MFKRWFSAFSRRWWLILILGLIFGLAIGLPVGGKYLFNDSSPNTFDVLSPPANSAGSDINAFVEHPFQIDPQGQYYVLSWDPAYLTYNKLNVAPFSQGAPTWVHSFTPLQATGSQPVLVTLDYPSGMGGFQDSRVYRIFISNPDVGPMTIYRAFPGSYQTVNAQACLSSEIVLFPFDWTVEGFHFCDGGQLNIAQNSTLSSILGKHYGGDGVVTFGVPTFNFTGTYTLDRLHYQIYLDGLEPASPSAPPTDSIQYCPVTDFNQYWMDFYLGQIVLASHVTSDASWLVPCDGSRLNIQQNTALYSLLNNYFGDFSQYWFNTPDMSSVPSPIEGAKYYVVSQGKYPPRY